MSRLLFGAMHELLGRWGLPAALIWLLLAAGLAADAALGSGSLGDYLALVSLLPVALLFRLTAMAERRQRDGWDDEERLRDPRGWRLPLAEAGGATLLLFLLLAAACLPLLTPSLRPATEQGEAARPVWLETGSDEWRLALPLTCPPGARLEILLEWEQVPNPPLLLRSAAGGAREVQPGALTVWELDDDERSAGELVLLRLPGAQVRREWLRLVAPRPGLAATPKLLAGQLLFFAPLFAVGLLLARRGVRGGLAGLGALGLGGLAVWQPPLDPDLGASPAGWLADALLRLAEVLPPVEGLLATGPDAVWRAGAASWWAVGLWWLLGGVALALSRRRGR